MEHQESASCSAICSSATPAPQQRPSQQGFPHEDGQFCPCKRHVRRRGGTFGWTWAMGLVLGLSMFILACQPVSAARLFTNTREQTAPDTMRQWQELLERTDYSAFEDAFEATYNGSASGDASRTLQQYDEMVEWLVQSPSLAYMQIHELHNYAVRELVYDAVQLAKKPFNETAALTVLEYISTRLAQVSSKYGYPVARRVIMGALLKQRLEHGPFSKPVQAQVDKILLQLFQLHKKSTANKGAVQFFHISKSGGTNLCQSAQQNGCATEGFDERSNCLIRDFNDVPRWVGGAAHKYVEYRLTGNENPKEVLRPWFVNFHSERKTNDGCAERWAMLKKAGWNFYANEFTLPPGEKSLCKEFVNLLMFRQPLDRLRSQISWIQKLYKKMYEGVDIARAFKGRTSGFWERLVPAAVNNYYIRSLLGQRFFEYPIVAINSTHVQRAKIQVLLHDVLLTLENKDFNDVSLKVGLGWETSLQDSNIRSSTDIADEINLPIDYEAMETRNVFDVQVYDFARELQALDVLLFNFISLLDGKLGLKNLSTDRCGYVSLSAFR